MEDWGPPCDASPDVYPSYGDLVRAIEAGNLVAYRDRVYDGEATVSAIQTWTNSVVKEQVAAQKAAKEAEREAHRLEMEEWKKARQRVIAEYDAKVAQICAERGLVLWLDDGRAGHFNFMPQEEMVKEKGHMDDDAPGWMPVIYTSMEGRALVDERVGKVYLAPGIEEEALKLKETYETAWKASEQARKATFAAINKKIAEAREKSKAEARIKSTESGFSSCKSELETILAKKITSGNVDTIGRQLELLLERYESYTTELVELHGVLGRTVPVIEVKRGGVEARLSEITTYAASLVTCSVCGKRLRKNSLRSHEKKCVAKQAEEEREEKERAERELAYQTKREAQNAKFREEQARRNVEHEAKKQEEKLVREEAQEVALSNESPEIAKAISKLRRAPKHAASEKQVGFTCSRFTEVFGRPLSTDLVAKLSVGSKKSVSGIIDLINAASIMMTLQHGRKNGVASEKQVSYAKRLVAQVYATDWESSRLGKAGTPFPNVDVISKLGRAEVSAVIDQLQWLVRKNSDW